MKGGGKSNVPKIDPFVDKGSHDPRIPKPEGFSDEEWQLVADTTTLTQTSDLDYGAQDDDDDLDIPEFLR